MKNIDYIVDFAVHLGQEMLICGANLERVNIAMETICGHYDVRDLGIHSLSTVITVSGSDAEGNTRSNTLKIPAGTLDMEKLKSLHKLVRRVANENPEPSQLQGMLNEATAGIKMHGLWTMLGAYVVAMLALARLFGGGYQELICVTINTIGLFFLTKALSRLHLNKIITNFFCMLIAGCFAAGMAMLGFVQNYWVVVLTNAFYLIPGIQMVNSVRNLLCGNEMNGIIDMMKTILETIAICAGLAASYFIFGEKVGLLLEDAFPAGDYTNIIYDLELLVLSFFASVGFGLTFNISWKEISYAGLGAVLVRLVYIGLLILMPSHRFLFMMLAAFIASVFSEIMAMIKHTPASYYLYPFVVPLIPGDLFAFTMFGIWWQNSEMFLTNARECIFALMGISVGFVFGSSVMHFVRKSKIRKKYNLSIKK